MVSSSAWPLRWPVSDTGTTFSPGVNRADSAAQFDTTLVGATMRNGGAAGLAWRAWLISAKVCSVLPRPMSSARIPPSWCSHRNASHANPSSW